MPVRIVRIRCLVCDGAGEWNRPGIGIVKCEACHGSGIQQVLETTQGTTEILPPFKPVRPLPRRFPPIGTRDDFEDRSWYPRPYRRKGDD